MRVYISVDMEGIAGVVHEDQTNPVDPRCAAEYARFRKLMTAEANAALAGAFGVPVVLASGDSALAAEAKDLLGEAVHCVVVKEAVSRHAAKSVAPAVACRLIRDAAADALRQKPLPRPFTMTPPIALEVDFQITVMADMAELVPGSTRAGPRTVGFTHEDYRTVFRAWRALYNLAGVA